MEVLLDREGQQRLTAYFERIGDLLGHPSRRASFAIYASGLLGDGERKSMEPIAARACAHPDEVSAVHQQLHHFLVNSDWSDREIRREAARYAIAALTSREAIETWQIDGIRPTDRVVTAPSWSAISNRDGTRGPGNLGEARRALA